MRWLLVDIVTPKTRSKMMSGIGSKNTHLEVVLRSGLHKRGLRFRLHQKMLPGNPDIVFPKYKAALFANGCFWHGHDCHLFRIPQTRSDFWKKKIDSNKERDRKNMLLLEGLGWRTGVIWECAMKGKARLDSDYVIALCESWIKSNAKHIEIRGK